MTEDRITSPIFEETVRREFAFLLDAGFRPPVFVQEDAFVVAAFEGDELRVLVKSYPADGHLWISLERPSLGRVLELETFHALYLAEPEYPIASGLAWPTHADFERTVAREAHILRLNLDVVLTDTETFNEVGGRL